MPRAYEVVLSEILEMDEANEAVQWTRAAYYREALDAVSARQLATDIGKSAATINKYVRTLKAFPTHEDRISEPPIAFSHHLLAAHTADPHGWLERAHRLQWSTRDLVDAIKAAKASDPVAEYQAQIDRAVQRLRKVHQEANAVQRDYLREMVDRWLREVGWRR